MPPENICRLCGVICQPPNFVQIFQNDCKSQLTSVGEMMLDCLFPVVCCYCLHSREIERKLEYHTGYPKIICQYCNLQLNVFYEFKKKVMEQHKKFTQLIKTNKCDKQEKYQKNDKIKIGQNTLADDLHSTCTNDDDQVIVYDDNNDCLVENNIKILSTNYLDSVTGLSDDEVIDHNVGDCSQNLMKMTIIENKPICTNNTNDNIDDDDHYDDDDDDDVKIVSDCQELRIDCKVEATNDNSEYSETVYLEEENYDEDENNENYLDEELDENGVVNITDDDFVNDSSYGDGKLNRSYADEFQKTLDDIMIAEYIDDPLDNDNFIINDGSAATNVKLRGKNLYNNKKRYQCRICQRYFTTQATCNSHEYRHTNIRPFPCEVCKKKFKLRCDLRVHMLCHNDVRKYACNICGKAFRMHSHLADHKETHVTENKIECDECGLKFKTSVTLKSHKKQIHSADHAHKCKFCNRGFYRKNKLTRHELSHTKPRKSRVRTQPAALRQPLPSSLPLSEFMKATFLVE